jgi:uncharacterized membrane protein required for colicin V production
MSWIGGILIGLFFSAQINNWLSRWIDWPDVLPVLSFVGSAFVFRFGLIQLANFLRAGVSVLLLGWADRVGGLVLGFLKGVVLAWVVLVMGVAHGEALKKGIKHSFVAPQILSVTKAANRWLPKDLHEKFEEQIEKLWKKTIET